MKSRDSDQEQSRRSRKLRAVLVVAALLASTAGLLSLRRHSSGAGVP